MKLFSIPSPLRLIQRAYSSYHTTGARRPASESLFRTIGPLGDCNGSVVPALDDWIRQGNSAQKGDLHRLINDLMGFRRFKHALEVSLWMTNEKCYPVSPYDISVRLKLIHKNLGLEQAESYFNKIPEKLRTYQIYLALLNCYTVSRSVDKAESVMQQARDLGYTEKAVWYNLMMSLHSQLGNRAKLGELLTEMDSKGISYDQFTYSICLDACAGASDSAGMDRVLRMMESDPAGVPHWQTLVNAAEGYLKIGSTDEALVVLDKLEKLSKKSSLKHVILAFLLKLYAEAGKKDELHRIWKICKNGKVVNKLYIQMMRSLMEFSDVEEMERVCEEWESGATLFDFRVPNVLIDVYCTDGKLDKAEALVARVVAKGGDPVVATWCHLAGGYVRKNRIAEAVRSLRKAISTCPPTFASHKLSLMTCLGYLQNNVNRKEAEELIKTFRTKPFVKR